MHLLSIYNIHKINSMSFITQAMKTFSCSSLFFIFFILSAFATFTFSYEEEISKHALKNYLELKLPSVSGPESLAFDCAGEGPYTGISDGRIFKWEATQRGWLEFAVNSPHRQYIHLNFMSI